MRHTFKAGDTVERIDGSAILNRGYHYAVKQSTSKYELQLAGHGTNRYNPSYFKLVPDREVKRKALSEAIDVMSRYGIGKYVNSDRFTHHDWTDGKSHKEVLDHFYPDNKEAVDKIQGIITQLEASLSEAQNQLFDLKGE